MSNVPQPKRQRALDLVLSGRSHAEVAAALGCRRETVWKWTREPAFAGELSERRADRRMAVGAELDAGALDAVRLLRGLLTDADAPAAARVRAAAKLLDRAGVTATFAVEVRDASDGMAALTDEELHAELARAMGLSEADLAAVERARSG